MVTLDADRWRIDIDPLRGAGITHCAFDAYPVFRPASARIHGFEPLGMGCFPLVPFSNRIANGRFGCDGRQVALAPVMPGEPHAIHGHGWVAPWAVERVDARSCSLLLEPETPDWPWAYRARQSLSIDANQLLIGLELENCSDSTMPAGLGLHPYFIRTDDCRLVTSVAQVWAHDGDGIPTQMEDIPADWVLDRPHRPGEVFLDHCFEGWSRHAELIWPEAGYAVQMEASDTAGRVVIYTPAGEDYFCVEPVSHAPNAHNWAGGDPETGLRQLAPGQSLTLDLTFTVTLLPQTEFRTL